MKIMYILSAVTTILFAAGCSGVENNYRSVADFPAHMVSCGIPVSSAQPAVPEALKATEGIIIKVGDSDIGIYKFDKNARVQNERLKKIEDNGVIYFLGAKYTAVVCGSFVLVDAEKNPRKDDIIKAFKAFK